MERMIQYVQDGNSLSYRYDGSGNQIEMSYEDRGVVKKLQHVYGSTNRLENISLNGEKVRDYAYTPAGRIDYVQNYRKFDTGAGDIVKIDYTYNSAGLPTNIGYFDNGVKKEEYTLQYDKRGYIIKEDIFKNYDSAKTTNKSYQYDEIGQLLKSINTADSKTTTTSYTYDKVGNRLTMSNGTDSMVYNYNQFNNLLDIKKNGVVETEFQYDANGNQKKEINKKDINGTLRDVTTDYVYDRANRLTNVTITDGPSTKRIANYYNGDGQRIKQDDDGYITKYYYDDGNLLFTTDDNNAKATENILDPYGVIVASKRFDGNYANMYYFYNYDARGSVTSIINPDGGLVKGYDYDEFGQTKETGDALFKNDVKFTGAVHDQSSNLYYMNARFYNPSTGRFLTQDSYKGNAYEPWTQHLYVYTGNNPVNYVDPTGHARESAYDNNGGNWTPEYEQSKAAPPKAKTVRRTNVQPVTGGSGPHVSDGSTSINNTSDSSFDLKTQALIAATKGAISEFGDEVGELAIGSMIKTKMEYLVNYSIFGIGSFYKKYTLGAFGALLKNSIGKFGVATLAFAGVESIGDIKESEKNGFWRTVGRVGVNILTTAAGIGLGVAAAYFAPVAAVGIVASSAAFLLAFGVGVAIDVGGNYVKDRFLTRKEE